MARTAFRKRKGRSYGRYRNCTGFHGSCGPLGLWLGLHLGNGKVVAMAAIGIVLTLGLFIDTIVL